MNETDRRIMFLEEQVRIWKGLAERLLADKYPQYEMDQQNERRQLPA